MRKAAHLQRREGEGVMRDGQAQVGGALLLQRGRLTSPLPPRMPRRSNPFMAVTAAARRAGCEPVGQPEPHPSGQKAKRSGAVTRKRVVKAWWSKTQVAQASVPT